MKRLVKLARCRLLHRPKVFMASGRLWLRCLICGCETDSVGWTWSIPPHLSAKLARFRRRLAA